MPHVERRQCRRRISACLGWLLCASAVASGPRYVSGPPFFTGQAGVPIGWRQPTLLYSTDPGTLSSSVNHQAADALVAAAAGAWNLPVASITLAQGPSLAEDVSGQNVYLSANGVVFPADVASSNAAAIPLAIVYDADGSVTDTLLGAGASAPLSCRQNAVTESVDAFDPAGYILHAIVIVNGRCSGPAPQQQLQLQYQLERAFGRVLGLAWSQANDNVFTGTPTPTAQQATHWPIMHPLDIICGTYTYQCLPNPFTLRSDDIASMVAVYPVASGHAGSGKSPSLAAAVGASNKTYFPSGEGMGSVNVLAQVVPTSTGVVEPWIEVSAVSGYGFRRGALSPFVAPDASVAGSFGSNDQNAIASSLMAYIPIVDGLGNSGVSLTSEALNPLYVGAYSVGPYALGTIAPSGTNLVPTEDSWVGAGQTAGGNFTVADAATACSNGADGTAVSPVPADSSGWWTGLICGYGHAAYVTENVRAGHSFTVEVTALDGQGEPTTTKLRPVLGLFAASDAATALPSLAVAPEPFQAVSTGMTSLMAASGQTSQVRLGIADQRNDGRPDYSYKARFFYGDTISPAVVGAAGATAVIRGSGFRVGNVVRINGVNANVTSWSASSLVVTLPTMALAGAGSGVAVDVQIVDLGTGAQATLSGALTYSTAGGLPNALTLVSAQSAAAYTGAVAPVALAVQELLADGVTPVAGAPVLFSVAAGSGTFGACGGATCTVLTDATGTASSGVTPLLAGTLTMQAVDTSHATATVTASFPVIATAGSMTLLSAPSGNVYTAHVAATSFSVRVLDASSRPMAGRAVRFMVVAGSAALSGCTCADSTVLTDGNGQAQVQVTPVAAGAVTLRAADGDLAQQASFTALSYADIMQLVASPASGSIPGVWTGTIGVLLTHGDGTPDGNEAVTFSGPPEVVFSFCSLSQCTFPTQPDGTAITMVKGFVAGTFTVSASFGTLVQTATFTIVASANHLTIVSLPTGVQAVGQQTTQPFAVRLTDALGNPISGERLTFEVPPSTAVFTSCNAGECFGITDSNGTASMSLRSVAAGQITVGADIGSLSVSGTYMASGVAGFLTVVQQPGAAGAVLDSPQTLLLKLTGPDGVTPMANQNVNLQTISGSMTFTYCGGTSVCTYSTDQNGLVSMLGVPTALGAVVMEGFWSTLTTSFSFNVHAASDVLTVIRAPASGTIAGSVAAVPLVMQVSLPDGVTAVPAGRSVTLSVATGSASFQACSGAATCTVVTDSAGRISTAVTPLAAGTIALLAAEGGGNQTATFIAAAAGNAPPQPDVLLLKSLPGNGTVAGTIGVAPFSVTVFSADGVTPTAGRSVTLAVSGGEAMLTVCGASSCVVMTGADGVASSPVTPAAAGTIVLNASETSAGSVVTAGGSFTAVAAPDLLRITFAPATSVTVGSETSLVVQALLADGVTPATGKTVSFAITAGVAALGACSGNSCAAATAPAGVVTDAQGLASIAITPLAAGAVVVTAAEGVATVVANFVAVAPVHLPDTMLLLTAPSGTTPVGQANATAFAVKVLLGDGVTPAVGQAVAFSVTAGSATLAACGGASCTVLTSAGGVASTTVTPTAAGVVTLTATEVSLPTNTLSASFVAATPAPPPPLPDTILLLTAPSGTTPVGQANATAFAVKVLLGDGVTPAVGQAVAFSVTAGSATLAACGGASCTVLTSAGGVASTTVTPTAAGGVTLTATEVSLPTNTLSASFVAATPAPPPPPPLPDTILLLTAPSGTTPVGQANATAFAVKVLLGDGVTPAVGQAVAFSVTAGSATLAACGGASCTVMTSAGGVASTTVTPTAAGGVTLTATEVSLPTNTLSASFVATVPPPPPPLPDTILLLTAPSGTTPVGQANATAFAVKVLLGDGVTPAVGQAVVFSVTAGSATLAACGGASCTVLTSASGVASTTVTPTAAGGVTLTATEVSLPTNTLSASFVAATPAPPPPPPLPDTILLLTAPSGTTLVGQVNVTAFAVKVLLGDGVTPAVGLAVAFSVTAGSATLAACGGASCTVMTSAGGVASTTVTPTAAGGVTLTATEVSVPTNTLSASFVAATPAPPPPLPDTMSLLTAPSGTTPVGQANATAFAVKVLLGDGVTPAVGQAVVFSVTAGSATLAACGGASCTVLTSAGGVASTTVTPTAAGGVTLTATEVSVPTNTLSASFVAATPAPPPPLPDTMSLLTAPSGTTPVGQANATAFAVKVLLGDGVTPAVGQAVAFSVTAGSATLAACGAASCTVLTSAGGVASTTVTPTAAGGVTLTATEVSVPTNTLSASFVAATPAPPPPLPDTMSLLTAPSGTTPVGQANATAFAVKVLLGDGVTPAVGQAVVFSVTAGSATLAACGGASCTVLTSAGGVASTTVTPTAAGGVTLTATEVSVPTNTLSASFVAATPAPPPPLPDTMSLLTAPSGTTPVGQANATAFAVKVLLGDGVTPAVGQAVVFSVTAGSATLAACGGASCTVLTSASGVASTTVTPTAAGGVTLTATEVSVPTNTLSASFNAVQVPVVPPPVSEMLVSTSTPGASAFLGTYAATPFTVVLTLSDGVTPVAGVPVSFTNGGGSGQVTFSACGLATCTATTNASGVASTRVLAAGAGTVLLAASAPSPGQGLATPGVTTPFQVVANQLSLIAVTPAIFLAEGATEILDLTATALENGAAPSGLAVLWQAKGAVQLLSSQSVTRADGSSSMQATIGPLGGGAQASVDACAWSNTCATFTATGVSAESYQVAITSGGWQSLSRAAAGAFAPVVAQVTDGAGHAVAGATVSVYQEVTAVAVACPTSGRCPAEPVLGSQVSLAMTDANGTITAIPLVGGPADTQTRMAFSAGTQGFATTVLTSLP